jgi:hypothetical protein
LIRIYESVKAALVALLLLLTTKAYTQSFSAGVVAGISSTDVSGIDPYDGDMDFFRIGLVAGGFVNRSLNDRSSFQMEILYATKGSLQPGDSSTGYIYDRLRLYYMEVPILFKYKMHLIVNKEALDKLEVEAGPSFAYLVHSSHENLYGEIENDRPFNKTDYLINIGLNYYFTSDFSLDIRFATSIVPIRSHVDNLSYMLNNGNYNMTLNYTFRYIFR